MKDMNIFNAIQDRQRTYNLKLRRVRAIIVAAVKKYMLHTTCVNL